MRYDFHSERSKQSQPINWLISKPMSTSRGRGKRTAEASCDRYSTNFESLRPTNRAFFVRRGYRSSKKSTSSLLWGYRSPLPWPWACAQVLNRLNSSMASGFKSADPKAFFSTVIYPMPRTELGVEVGVLSGRGSKYPARQPFTTSGTPTKS
jgi:hypothetical protein